MNDTVSEDVKLEPCPHGHEQRSLGMVIVPVAEGNAPRWYVRCMDCSATGPRTGTRESAIEAWNRRAYLAATKPPLAGDVTEAIAQIIDPHSFMPDNSGDDLIAEMVRQGRELAFSKATRILSALASPPMPGRGEGFVLGSPEYRDYINRHGREPDAALSAVRSEPVAEAWKIFSEGLGGYVLSFEPPKFGMKGVPLYTSPVQTREDGIREAAKDLAELVADLGTYPTVKQSPVLMGAVEKANAVLALLSQPETEGR